MKIPGILRIGIRGVPLIPIALMAIAVGAAVLAANTQIQESVTIQTFQMQADTVSGTSCTTTPLTSISYGVVPTGQPLPNQSFCLTNTSPSPVFTGGGTITAPTFTQSSGLPVGITEDWLVGSSPTTACVGTSVAKSLTITAPANSNAWTVSGVANGFGNGCSVGSTITDFVLAHTGSSTVPGTYTWTTTLNAYTTATG